MDPFSKAPSIRNGSFFKKAPKIGRHCLLKRKKQSEKPYPCILDILSILMDEYLGSPKSEKISKE